MLTVALAGTGCGSSTSTNVTSPSTTRCQPSVTGSTTSFGPAGGTGTVSIAVSRECGWSATTQAAWIEITSGREGQGDGTVSFLVRENPDPVSRRAGIAVEGRSVELVQEPAPCRFDVSAPSEPADANGGATTIEIRTHSLCRWTAASEVPWVTVTPSTGQGNAVIQVTVAPNTGAVRTGAVVVAGARVELAQAAPGAAPVPNSPTPAPPPTSPTPPPTSPTPPPTSPTPPPTSPTPPPCTYSLTPAQQSFAAPGGTGSVRVTTGTGCAWTASSNATWLVLLTPTGAGTADIGYTVAPNLLASNRETTITVAGSVHRVTQSAAPSDLGRTIELEGTVRNLTGSCPDLEFTIRTVVVTTTQQTTIRKGNCSHVVNGLEVEVEGTRQLDGSVAARILELDR